MSSFSQIMNNPLINGCNAKEVIKELMNKEALLRQQVQKTLTGVNQYQKMESRLIQNNAKLDMQMTNSRQMSLAVINAIAKNTAELDATRRDLHTFTRRNADAQKRTREALQNEAAYYTETIVNAKVEYRATNLQKEINSYKEQISSICSMVHDVEAETEALEAEAGAFSLSQELSHTEDLIKFLEDDKDMMVRKKRTLEEIISKRKREVKELKIQISQIAK